MSGINLAYGELFYTFVYILRRSDLTINDETKAEDMQWHDAFGLVTFGHLKVKIKRAGGLSSGGPANRPLGVE